MVRHNVPFSATLFSPERRGRQRAATSRSQLRTAARIPSSPAAACSSQPGALEWRRLRHREDVHWRLDRAYKRRDRFFLGEKDGKDAVGDLKALRESGLLIDVDPNQFEAGL